MGITVLWQVIKKIKKKTELILTKFGIFLRTSGGPGYLLLFI